MESYTNRSDESFGDVNTLTRAELAEDWEKAYKNIPPKGVKRGLLERSYAYHLQVKQYGGLKPKTRRSLLEMTSGTNLKPVQTNSSSKSLKPGTRLIREWHGKSHQVMVTDTGFVRGGYEYTSLSAIAKAITGTKWSGPRFFGL